MWSLAFFVLAHSPVASHAVPVVQADTADSLTASDVIWATAVETADVLTASYAIPVTAADTVAVTVAGAGSPVVFVPGLVGSAFAFRHVTTELAAGGYQTIVIEPLGIGRSGRPREADYSSTAQAHRVATVLDSLQVRGALVVAHSVSASIAYRLALQRPELVSAILSIEGGAAESAVTPGLRRALRFAPLIKLLGRDGLRHALVRNLHASSVDTTWITPEVIAGYTAHPARDVGATIDALQGMARSVEPSALGHQLADLRCPVRLMIGEARHTGAVPQEEVALLRASVADFQVIAASGVGHFIFEERPDVVVAAVRALTEVTPATAGNLAPQSATSDTIRTRPL